MEERINVAEILKDCPRGMELDCILFSNPVKYENIDTDDDVYPIKTLTENDDYLYFTKEGYLYNMPNSKCVIFPKGKDSWEGFVPPCKFKDRYVLFVDSSDDEEDEAYQYIFILNKPEYYGKWHSHCFLDGCGRFDSKETYLTESQYHPRFATEEEKQKLFESIKANGYRWNSETKTLEKLIEPKYKIGDKIKEKGTNAYVQIKAIKIDKYQTYYETLLGDIPVRLQDNWELVQDKFDINTLKPFDKVLVRSVNSDIWECDLFSSYNPNCSNKFHCIGAWYEMCIPYKGNEDLLGTTDDCNEFYKTWE